VSHDEVPLQGTARDWLTLVTSSSTWVARSMLGVKASETLCRRWAPLGRRSRLDCAGSNRQAIAPMTSLSARDALLREPRCWCVKKNME